jgi:hypothetical protein
MHRHERTPSEEFRAAVDSLQDLAEAEGTDQLQRAAAVALEKPLREKFRESFDADRPADPDRGEDKCIARLTHGLAECPHDLGGEGGRDVPHRPPEDDHSDLWLRNGTPVCWTLQPYGLDDEKLGGLREFGRRHELAVDVSAASWYFPTKTPLVILR